MSTAISDHELEDCARAIIEAATWDEEFTGEHLDLDHPNGHQELCRIAAWNGLGKMGWQYATKDEKAAIRRLVNRFLTLLRERRQARQ